LGVLYSQASALEKAAIHFEEAVRLDPGYAAAHMNLAEALQALGREREAAEHREAYERLQAQKK
jgi:Tfp pilus assembly protein PilF